MALAITEVWTQEMTIPVGESGLDTLTTIRNFDVSKFNVFMVLSLSTNLPGGDWPENLTPQSLPVADIRLSKERELFGVL